MSSAPTSSRPNRAPWIIVSVLGCVLVCLMAAIAGGGLYLFFGARQESALPAGSIPRSQTSSPSSVPAVVPTISPLNQAATRLDALTSYQATLHIKASGTQGNQPFQWTYTITRALSSNPAPELAAIDTSGLGKDKDYAGTVFIRAGERFFARWSAGKRCAPTSPDLAQVFMVAPGTMLPDLGDSQKGESEPVAGISADRYTLSGVTSGVTGKVWVAKEGDFVVQASVQQDGSLPRLGADVKGHAEWEYSLTKINQPLTPDLPLSCRHLLDDLPIPADATNLSATDDLLRYSTATTLADLVNFFNDKMTQAGWESRDKPMIAKDKASLAFSRKSEEVLIGIFATGRTSDVMVVYK